MFRNHFAGLPLLADYAEIQAFSDVEHVADNGQPRYATQTLLQTLIEQNPDALFVFNTHPVDTWLRSRCLYTDYLQRLYRFDRQRVLNLWR